MNLSAHSLPDGPSPCPSTLRNTASSPQVWENRSADLCRDIPAAIAACFLKVAFMGEETCQNQAIWALWQFSPGLPGRAQRFAHSAMWCPCSDTVMA